MAQKEFSNIYNTLVPIPLYKLVQDRILLDLYQHSLPDNRCLGTEADLCRKYHVGRNTIRHAVDELVKAGYLKRRQKLGVIITDKNLLPRQPVPGKRNIIMLLPLWNYTAGNYFERFLVPELCNESPPFQAFNVNMILYHDSLSGDYDDLYAVIAVDPLLQQLPALEQLSQKGIRIYTVEAQINFYMAANLRPDIDKACHKLVNHLISLGHRRIGLVKQPGSHITFQQWHDSFINCMAEHELAIYPHTIIEIPQLAICDQTDFRKTTAWICTTKADLAAIAVYLRNHDIKIPADVSLICADEPRDHEIPDLNSPVSVYRSDYRELGHLLRHLLEAEASTLTPGSVYYYPMLHISGQSVAKCRL